MPRNLDLTALRSFVTVADTGGVTRAAGILNLTQSAVSMQLKRLEEGLGLALLDRAGRGVALTAAGEQLAGYGRRMLALNDEALQRLTSEDYEGEIRFGVPHDVIYPNVPRVLRAYSTAFPRMRVHLVSAPTLELKAQLSRGACDLILTTEDAPGPGGEVLIELPLHWIGAKGGAAWRQRPLPLALCSNCVFRPGVIHALDAGRIGWTMSVDSARDNAVEAAVSADLAIGAAIEGHLPPETEVIVHGGALPDLGSSKVVLYTQAGTAAPLEGLAQIVRRVFGRTLPVAVTA